MCYAVPGRVLKIEGTDAEIDFDGVKKKANVEFLEDVSVGDYVLVHAGFAIEHVDTKKAEDTIKILKEAILKDGKNN